MVKIIDGHINVRGYVRTHMFLSVAVQEEDLWKVERLEVRPDPKTGAMTYTFYDRTGTSTFYSHEA